MKTPVISVIMATFNEPINYLKEAIESIQNQTFKDFEFIIIDDSIDPESIKTIDSYQTDERIIVVRNERKLGFVNALNKGLKIARGQFIARMDADDISLADRFEKQIDFLQKHRNIDILGGNLLIINEKNQERGRRKYPSKKMQLRFNSIFRSPVAHPSIMFRRTIVDNELFYDNSFSKAEDTEFWFRLRNKGYKIANLNEYLLKFRITGDLANKRTNEHFFYNHKARRKNFSWKYSYVDIPSYAVSKLYSLVPKKVKSTFYSLENNNNQPNNKK